MSREYKISCTPLRGAALSALLRQLPSPIKRPQLKEIYNYRVDSDGYYFVDRLVDRSVAASALLIFLDAALTTERSITVAALCPP